MLLVGPPRLPTLFIAAPLLRGHVSAVGQQGRM